MDFGLCRKIFGRIPYVDIKPQQVSNRLTILPRIQPPEDTVSTRSIQGGAGNSEFAGQMVNRLGTLFFGGLRRSFWRHAFKIQLVNDFLVALEVVEPPDLRWKGVESTIGFLFLATVATDAVLLAGRTEVGSSAVAVAIAAKTRVGRGVARKD